MAKSGKTSFKDSIALHSQLSAAIGERRFAPVYLLMGEEPYFIDSISERLADSVLAEAEKAFNQIVVYGKDTDEASVINFARQMPMMGGRQLIVVREAQQLRKIDQLSLYTANPSPHTILVICHKGKSVDKRSQLYKHVSTKGSVLESVRPRDYEISSWLEGFVKSKGCSIEPQALGMLVDHLGADISKISNELDKLLTYLPQGTRKITALHISENIGISKEFNNYELTRAISERDFGRVMQIVDYFKHNQKDNPFVVTLSVLFSHFQRIFIVNYKRWQSRARGVPMPGDMELMSMLKLTSPFFVKEYLSASGKFPNKKVFIILGLLREYDMKSKGIDGGSADSSELLEELLLKIMLL